MSNMFYNRRFQVLFAALMFLVLWSMGIRAESSPLASLDDLPPGERYRQLSLLVLLADGMDDNLLLRMFGGVDPAEQVSLPQTEELQQYTTPLARIADPQSMLSGTAQMIRFARQNRSMIDQELAAIEKAYPILVSMVNMDSVREDAIIIRSAVADSLQYSPGDESAVVQMPGSGLLAYQEETVRQRNTLEYLLFQREIDEVTESAIDELSYKLDAYQRMADDELDPELMRGRIDAAEGMNEEARDRFKEQAYIRASTLYLMLIPAMVSVATN